MTEKPLACKSFANEAEIIPLPKDEVTPPVTKIYFDGGFETFFWSYCFFNWLYVICLFIYVKSYIKKNLNQI